MSGYKDLQELEQYKDEYPDNQACMTWIENGVAHYIVSRQMFETAEERDASMEMAKEMLGGLMESVEALTGKPMPSLPMDFYNGYVRFKEMPLSGTDFHNFVPVHGGITYGNRSGDGSYIYGFDTNHANDATNPNIKSTDWLKQQCENMSFGIQAAAKYEQEYMKASCSQERIQAIQKYIDYIRQECDGAEIGIGGLLTLLIDNSQEDENEE